MVNFNINSEAYYNDQQNTSTLLQNLGVFSPNLTGNVGQKVSAIINFTLDVSVNSLDYSDGFTFTKVGSVWRVDFAGNWLIEGLYATATINILQGSITSAETVNIITNSGNTRLIITDTNLTTDGFVAGTFTNVVIRLTSAPRVLIFKYSLTPSTDSINNYNSPYGGEQSFVKNLAVANTPYVMDFTSAFIGSKLATVTGTYISTTDTYNHNYRVINAFRLPLYVEGELGNLQTNIPPPSLLGLNTWRYGFEVTFQSTLINLTYVGDFGNVGYMNEEFNGGTANHNVYDISAGYPLNTNSEPSTTFKIKNNERNWLITDRVTARFVRLLDSVDYLNKTTAFETLWNWKEVQVVCDGVTGNDGDISIFQAQIDGVDPTILNCNLEFIFPAILSGFYCVWVTTGDYNPSTDIQAENHIISVDEFVNNLDVDGLVDKNFIAFYPSKQVSFPVNFATDKTDMGGWNGDFNGVAFQFDLKSSEGAYLSSAVFRLIAENTSDETDWFQLQQLNLFASRTVLLFTNPAITVETYQILGATRQNTLNIPFTDLLNNVKIQSVLPAVMDYGTDWQVYNGTFGFKINWRDWIFNSNVPSVFFNSTLPNNNLNFKTSNYSGVNDYAIKGIIDIGVKQHGNEHTTIYRLKGKAGTIADYDVNGGNGFTGVTTLYDSANNEVPSILTNATTFIEIEFNHSLGVLGQGLYGEIFIEQNGQITQDDRLHTSKNWSSSANLLTTSTGFVQVVNISNKTTLKCEVNVDNVVTGVVYNVYGRLGI